MANPNDVVRDAILRHLYKLHRSARGPKGVETSIRPLWKAMKEQGFTQKEVNSNPDYLVQKGWVREVVTPRRYTLPGGTIQQSDVRTYKISDIGVDKLEGASAYRREERFSGINITNIRGVTIIGSENVVNIEFSDLYRALDDLEKAVAESDALTDEDKLSATADIETLLSQLSKPKPDRDIIRTASSAIDTVLTAAGLVELLAMVAKLIGPLLG